MMMLGISPQQPAQGFENGAPTSTAPDPFQWSGSGKRMTAEQIMAQREIANRQIAAGMDYSPVGHWTQGLARTMQGVLGGLEARNADKAERASAEYGDRVMQALLARDTGSLPSAAPSEPGAAQPDPLLAAVAGSSSPAGNGGSAPPLGAGEQVPSPTALAPAPATGPAPAAGAPVDRSDIMVRALADPYLSKDVRGVAQMLLQQEQEANKPQYFTAGNDRVLYDPRSQQSSVLYHAQSDAQDYANSLGLQEGTPEYTTAMQDYVLRSSGPTAFGYDVDLEKTRSGNREKLEGVRQNNRLSLRQMPTYAQTHPRPSGGGGGHRTAGILAGPPRNTGAVYAPILAKVARGQPLSAGEQQVLDMRGRGGRSAAGGGRSSVAPRTATDPKTGRKVMWNGKAWVPAG